MAISFQNFIDKKWSLRSQAYFLKPLVNKKKNPLFFWSNRTCSTSAVYQLKHTFMTWNTISKCFMCFREWGIIDISIY